MYRKTVFRLQMLQVLLNCLRCPAKLSDHFIRSSLPQFFIDLGAGTFVAQPVPVALDRLGFAMQDLKGDAGIIVARFAHGVTAPDARGHVGRSCQNTRRRRSGSQFAPTPRGQRIRALLHGRGNDANKNSPRVVA
jgi:hypothetical protein